MLPAVLQSQQIKMQGSPLLEGQVRKIQPLPRVNHFKIVLTQSAIVNPILRLAFDLEVSEGFVKAIITGRALEPMHTPNRPAP